MLAGRGEAATKPFPPLAKGGLAGVWGGSLGNRRRLFPPLQRDWRKLRSEALNEFFTETALCRCAGSLAARIALG